MPDVLDKREREGAYGEPPSGGSSGKPPEGPRGTRVAESEAKIRFYEAMTDLLVALTPTILKAAEHLKKDIEADERA